MPGFLLPLTAPLACPHGGPAKPAPLPVRVRVLQQPVVLQTAACTVACPLPPQAPPRCVSAAWAVAALRVRSMGIPLVLTDSRAICAPSGGPLVIVPSQVRVRAQ
jgi:hypothetical protein